MREATTIKAGILSVAVIAALATARLVFGPFTSAMQGLLVVAAALCAIPFFLSPKMRINILLLYAALGVSLYLAEAGLTLRDWMAQKQAISDARAASLQNQDNRTALELVRDLTASGEPAVPIIGPREFVDRANASLFPLGGIANKITVHCKANKWNTYNSDAHGFHNPPSNYAENEYETIIVGDSYANGYCVACEEDVASALRRMGHSSLNLGIGGNGPLIELAGLTEYAKFLKPHHLFWLFFEGNDMNDLKRERTDTRLFSYLRDDFSQNLMDRQQEVDAELFRLIGEATQPKPRNWRLPSWLLLRATRGMLNLAFKPEYDSKDMELLHTILNTAKRRAKAWGGTLVFVYLPTIESIQARQPSALRTDILAWVRQQGIPTIDMTEVFQAEKDPLDFFPHRKSGHYNARGYAKVAGTLDGYLHNGR